MPQEGAGVEVETPVGKFRARGTDVISLLGLLCATVMAAVLYMHMEDARMANGNVVTSNKEVATALKESNAEFAKQLGEVVRVQRLSTCILATDQDKREREYMKADSFCNRVSQ